MNLKSLCIPLFLGLTLCSTALADPYSYHRRWDSHGTYRVYSPNRAIVVNRSFHHRAAPYVIHQRRAPVRFYHERPVERVVIYDERPVERVIVYRDRPVRDYDYDYYSGSRAAGSILGAVAGGIIGSRFGRGSGRAAATAAGVVLGGVVGRHLAD